MEEQRLVRAIYAFVFNIQPIVALAYDIQILINKGTYDIIRPKWITDCVHANKLLPMTKKYVHLLLFGRWSEA